MQEEEEADLARTFLKRAVDTSARTIVHCHYGPRAQSAKGFNLDPLAVRYSGIVISIHVAGFESDTG